MTREERGRALAASGAVRYNHDDTWTVQGRSPYTVAGDPHDMSCTCMDYMTRCRPAGDACKHVYAVLVSEGLMA